MRRKQDRSFYVQMLIIIKQFAIFFNDFQQIIDNAKKSDIIIITKICLYSKKIYTI